MSHHGKNAQVLKSFMNTLYFSTLHNKRELYTRLGWETSFKTLKAILGLVEHIGMLFTTKAVTKETPPLINNP